MNLVAMRESVRYFESARLSAKKSMEFYYLDLPPSAANAALIERCATGEVNEWWPR